MKKMNRKMSNQEIADLLKGMAAAYQIKGDKQFRVRAYEEAAVSVEHATSTIKDIWDEGQLEELPGVGKALAGYLDELFRTGQVKHFQKVMKDFPPAMFEFLEIPGVGAKTAFKLAKKLKITQAKNAKEKLKQAALAGEIRIMPGFGEESEKDILTGLKEMKQRSKTETRMTLPFAGELAKEILAYLKKGPQMEQIEPLGSLRRRVATVGDLDFGVATRQQKEVIKHFCRYPKAKEVVAAGSNTARILTTDKRQIDLKTVSPEAFGALLQHYTGSKQHNIHLREIAQKKKLSLSEYGIKSEKGVKRYRDEEAFYRALGMDWIPPELREDVGEIEAAQNHRLPNLVTLKDIRGDLHLHSNLPVEPSHDLGQDTVLSMAQKASELGYEYVGFAEHNPSLSQHTKKQIISLLKRKKEVIEQFKSSNKKLVQTINILNGLEIDIRPNGDLAMPEKGFAYLDYAIVSIHGSFRQSRQKATQRVLKALEHPKAVILGHPTGRMLNRREGMEFDWEQIFAFCLKKKKFLEINAWPARLDLPDQLVREAVKNGVKMVINTDAHALEEMSLMEYGVSVARRGWVEKEAIFNTLSYAKMKTIFVKIKNKF
ncbi:MAG: DNA polymerase/3'-5' exonuclease PolX [Candidatus Marinimicrobia bacterium]|nr:DNA polymerase/3'-5' exonuclease PolX [Candidatus Neomarinimicrobiota bacterium]